MKKAAKRSMASGSTFGPTEKWKPVASMPVNAFDEPPCRVKKALNAPSSGSYSVPRNIMCSVK